MGPERIRLADGKISRLGHMGRPCRQNRRVYVGDATRWGDASSALVVGEKQQNGMAAKAAVGIGYNGAGALRAVGARMGINGEVFTDMLKNAYRAGCRETYSANYVFEEDNAPARTKKGGKARVGSRMPAMLALWPARSPDLCVMDFAARGILAQWADSAAREQNISTGVAPKVTMRAAVKKFRDDLPMAQRRVLAPRRRIRGRVWAGGGHF